MRERWKSIPLPAIRVREGTFKSLVWKLITFLLSLFLSLHDGRCCSSHLVFDDSKWPMHQWTKQKLEDGVRTYERWEKRKKKIQHLLHELNVKCANRLWLITSSEMNSSSPFFALQYLFTTNWTSSDRTNIKAVVDDNINILIYKDEEEEEEVRNK